LGYDQTGVVRQVARHADGVVGSSQLDLLPRQPGAGQPVRDAAQVADHWHVRALPGRIHLARHPADVQDERTIISLHAEVESYRPPQAGNDAAPAGARTAAAGRTSALGRVAGVGRSPAPASPTALAGRRPALGRLGSTEVVQDVARNPREERPGQRRLLYLVAAGLGIA